jgi:hypothetical protein
MGDGARVQYLKLRPRSTSPEADGRSQIDQNFAFAFSFPLLFNKPTI